MEETTLSFPVQYLMIPNNPLTGETTGDFESRISALLQVSPEEAAQVLATARGMDTAQSTDFLMGLLGHSELALALITEISTSRHTEMGSWASKLTADQPMSPKQPDPQSAPLKSINSKKKNKNKKKLEKLVIVGDAATVNGRRICSCLATVHILSTNCLTCGKIICELEFSDDPLKCPFCTAGLDKTQQQVPYAAVERLNVLLDYDQTSAQRSRVIDVAGDYDRGVYDKWKTPEERAQAVKRLQELERQKEENRNKRVISLDIVSGKVTMQKVAPPAFEMARDSQCKNEAQAPLVKTGHARIKKQLVYPVTEHTDKGKRALHRYSLYNSEVNLTRWRMIGYKMIGMNFKAGLAGDWSIVREGQASP